MLTLQLFGTNYSLSGENRCGGVLPSSWYYREPLTATMLILRPPLSSDRFYLGHNYSLFEARSSTGYIKVSCFSLFRFAVSRFLSLITTTNVLCVTGWPSVDQHHLQLSDGRTRARARARAYRYDAKVSLHLSHCGNFRGQSRMPMWNYLEVREMRAAPDRERKVDCRSETC